MYKYCPYCSRKLPKTGKSDNLQFCDHCEAKIYHHTPQTSACILLNRQNQVLLVKRRNDPFKGLWSLPAGFVNYGESPIDAGIRELGEETGLIAKYDKVVGVYLTNDHPKTFSVLTVIKVKDEKGKPIPSDDVTEVKFFDPKKLPKIAFKAQVRAIKKHLSSLTS